MTARTYAELVLPRIQAMAEGQLAPIEAAGRAVAAAITAGHRVWLTQTSHTIHLEGTHRAGGLMAVDTLEDPASIDSGDVVIVGTSAGTTAGVVGLAQVARERGAVVVALTGVAFELDPRVARADGGPLLHQVADITVDLGSPFGDGEFTLPGTAVAMLPSTGATGVVALWMIFAEAVAELEAVGREPLVWQSNLLPGAIERNAELLREYESTGLGYFTSRVR